MRKLDLHCHLLPRDLPDLAERYGYGEWIRLEHSSCHTCANAKMYKGDVFFREVQPNCWDPDTRIADSDRDGVNVQVLSTIPVYFSYWATPKDALDLANMINDDIARVVQQHPRRFIGLGTLPMQDPELALQELKRCVLQLGFPGVEIGTHVNNWNLDAPELFPVFQEGKHTHIPLAGINHL
jgi:aminocarboxymuconate-semialdehyde decarboxylase